jgi:hypothetical protein
MPSRRRRLRSFGALAAAVVAAPALWLMAHRPSSDRPWLDQQARVPGIAFDGDVVHIRNVRNTEYRSADDYTVRYEDRSYDLDRLERVWLALAPFSHGWRGPAHIFLSFEFADSQFVAVSVEARREQGEEYSIWKGMLRRYELTYVIGDERDLLGLRAIHWNDPTYLYPVRATPEQAREVFTRMLRHAQQLEEQPEFYNTLFSNCTTNIIRPVNQFATNRIRYGWQVLLPGYADDLAWAMGLIDDDGTFEDVRARHRINERAQAARDAEGFSEQIRGLPGSGS